MRAQLFKKTTGIIVTESLKKVGGEVILLLATYEVAVGKATEKNRMIIYSLKCLLQWLLR